MGERILPRFLTVDPGEDTGWSVWDDRELVESGTTKMWEFSDALWASAVGVAFGHNAVVPSPEQELINLLEGVELLVTENWSLYPWELRKGTMDWDECRTARLIGSIYACCRLTGWAYEQQPALIKERALAAGAEALFSHPLRENRHANDAIMHGTFRVALAAGAPWTDLSTKDWNA